MIVRNSGHLMSDCRLLKKEKESQSQKTPVGLINSKKSELAINEPVLLPVETHVVPKPSERYFFDSPIVSTLRTEQGIHPWPFLLTHFAKTNNTSL